MFEDHTPIEVNDFGGLWSRDSFTDSVPADHFVDSLNTITVGEEIRTRNGFNKSITLANLRRIFVYRREGEADRILALNSGGKLYDTTLSLSTPILDIATMTDFSAQVSYGRCYITPSNGVKGLISEFVYVYNGTGTARKAAGAAPSGGLDIALSATAGVVETGLHIIAVSYQTDSGFITVPGPTLFPTITADGAHKLNITNIPVGPTGTSKRRLLASRAIQDYNGDQEGYEMFFIPDGSINDNVTTNLTVDFYDADLQISADYTFDQLSEIPAALFISTFANRLCYGGENLNPSMLRISKDGEPESVNELAGFVICDPHETEGIKGAVEFRKSLYITKGNPGHTYATQDNGYEPSTWNCPSISKSIGADFNGIGQYIDTKGADADFFVVANTMGVNFFNGSYNDPKFSLSFKINKLWGRVNKAYMNKIQVIIDPDKYYIYLNVPLDSATSPSHILIADYSGGLDWQNIVWHIWTFNEFVPVSMAVNIDFTTKEKILKVAGYSGHIYSQVVDQYNDDAVEYDSYIQFAMHYTQSNWIHHYAGIGLRIKGSGVLTTKVYSQDNATNIDGPNLTLSATPGKEFILPINFENEKASVKIKLDAINENFQLRAMRLYCQAVWASRPY